MAQSLEPGEEDVIEVYRSLINPITTKGRCKLGSFVVTQAFLEANPDTRTFGALSQHLYSKRGAIAFGAHARVLQQDSTHAGLYVHGRAVSVQHERMQDAEGLLELRLQLRMAKPGRGCEYNVTQSFVLPHPVASQPVYDGDHVYLIESVGKQKHHGVNFTQAALHSLLSEVVTKVISWSNDAETIRSGAALCYAS